MFKLSSNSLKKLEGVDAKLVAVVKLAIIKSKVDFGVSEGLRTTERQLKLFAKGKSQVKYGKHCEGLAVDLYAYIDGKANWERKNYRWVVQAMFDSAIELGVPLRAGFLWRDFEDSPHFETV